MGLEEQSPVETGPDAVLYSSWLPVMNTEEELRIMSVVLTALGENSGALLSRWHRGGRGRRICMFLAFILQTISEARVPRFIS